MDGIRLYITDWRLEQQREILAYLEDQGFRLYEIIDPGSADARGLISTEISTDLEDFDIDNFVKALLRIAPDCHIEWEHWKLDSSGDTINGALEA